MKTTFKINILYYSTSFEWAMRDLIFMNAGILRNHIPLPMYFARRM